LEVRRLAGGVERRLYRFAHAWPAACCASCLQWACHRAPRSADGDARHPSA